MVVDDNKDIADAIKLALQMDGYHVDVFSGPLLALKHLKSNPKKYALIISDVRMPGMSGIELVANIKELEPEVKAIFITAFEVESLKPELERYDCEVAEIFQKPFFMKNLRKTVKSTLIGV
jgi:DNA-binding NtrC family response regulator